MPKALQSALLSLRDLLITYAPFLALAAAVLFVAYRMLDPTPPKRVVLATGTAQGAYAEFGKRYAEILKGYGITVELRETQGAAENLALLRDPNSGVDIAFVQGGADQDANRQRGSDAGDDRNTGLVSLGSMFYEPVWFFYREEGARRLSHDKRRTLDSFGQLAGWRINIGAPGSGVPVLMNKLIDANKLDRSTFTLLEQSQTPAVVDFLEGRIDALV